MPKIHSVQVNIEENEKKQPLPTLIKYSIPILLTLSTVLLGTCMFMKSEISNALVEEQFYPIYEGSNLLSINNNKKILPSFIVNEDDFNVPTLYVLTDVNYNVNLTVNDKMIYNILIENYTSANSFDFDYRCDHNNYHKVKLNRVLISDLRMLNGENNIVLNTRSNNKNGKVLCENIKMLFGISTKNYSQYNSLKNIFSFTKLLSVLIIVNVLAIWFALFKN